MARLTLSALLAQLLGWILPTVASVALGPVSATYVLQSCMRVPISDYERLPCQKPEQTSLWCIHPEVAHDIKIKIW